jgi:putative hemolysin
MFVQKLYVARPLHKVFTAEDTLIIDRTQILEVTDHYILVRDTEVKAGSEEFAPAGAALGT